MVGGVEKEKHFLFEKNKINEIMKLNEAKGTIVLSKEMYYDFKRK